MLRSQALGRPRDPARAARPRGARGGRPCSRCCARGTSRSARACRRSSSAFAARVGAPHASAVSSGTAALHLALRAVGVTEGDEVITSPFSLRRVARTSILYERAQPVFVDIDPRTLNLDVDAAAAAITAADHRAAAGAHLRLPGRHARAGAARAADRRGRLRGARRGARRRRRRSAAAAIPPRSASTPTSSSPPARAGCSRWAPPSTRSAWTPSATRAARRTWAGSTTTGSASTTGSPTSPARWAWPSCSGSTACSPTARGWRLVPRGAGRLRGARAAVRGLRRRRPRLVRVRRPAPARRRSRRHDPGAGASAASSPSRTCPRST